MRLVKGIGKLTSVYEVIVFPFAHVSTAIAPSYEKLLISVLVFVYDHARAYLLNLPNYMLLRLLPLTSNHVLTFAARILTSSLS